MGMDRLISILASLLPTIVTAAAGLVFSFVKRLRRRRSVYEKRGLFSIEDW